MAKLIPHDVETTQTTLVRSGSKGVFLPLICFWMLRLHFSNRNNLWTLLKRGVYLEIMTHDRHPQMHKEKKPQQNISDTSFVLHVQLFRINVITADFWEPFVIFYVEENLFFYFPWRSCVSLHLAFACVLQWLMASASKCLTEQYL